MSGHPLSTHQCLSTDKPSTDYFGLLGVRGQTGYQIFTMENTHNYVELNRVYPEKKKLYYRKDWIVVFTPVDVERQLATEVTLCD